MVIQIMLESHIDLNTQHNTYDCLVLRRKRKLPFVYMSVSSSIGMALQQTTYR
jgi:hypothetical protein